MFKYKDMDDKSKELLKSSQLPASIRNVIEQVYPRFIKSYGKEGVTLKFAFDKYDEELQTCKYIPGGHLPEFSLSVTRGTTKYSVHYGRYPNNDKILKLEKRDIIDREHENARYGYVDMSFRTVVPCIYEELGLLDADGRCFAKRDETVYLVNGKSETANPFGLNGAHVIKFFMVFESDGLYGLVNTSGEITLPAEYSKIELLNIWISNDFQTYNRYKKLHLQSFIQARKDNDCHLVNDIGRMVSTTSYHDEIHPCSVWSGMESYTYCYPEMITPYYDRNDKSFRYGLVNIVTKEELLPTIYASVSQKMRGVFAVKNTDGFWSLYNPNKRRFMFGFAEGWTEICLEKEVGVYSFLKGDVDEHAMKEYLFPAKRGGKWGYMNIYGVEKIKCSYTSAGFFNDGVAIVEQTDETKPGYQKRRHFLIDHHGNSIKYFLEEGSPLLKKFDEQILNDKRYFKDFKRSLRDFLLGNHNAYEDVLQADESFRAILNSLPHEDRKEIFESFGRDINFLNNIAVWLWPYNPIKDTERVKKCIEEY